VLQLAVEADCVTYCVAIIVERGLVLASDSRTNAGVDQVSAYSKMHRFCGDGERAITLLSSGNLATTQAVVRRLRRDVEEDAERSLKTARKLAEAAEYVGDISVAEQKKHSRKNDESFKPEASFILGGQIAGQPHQIYLVYPEGNYIRAARQAPYLQIGETKYGKPILDRIVEPELDLETVARCALVSMDSTMQSNITVGPPIELQIYPTDSLKDGYHYVLDEDDDYLRGLRRAWQECIKEAFAKLPHLPAHRSRIRLVDVPGDQ
jgi:putative proteasome-type protease